MLPSTANPYAADAALAACEARVAAARQRASVPRTAGRARLARPTAAVLAALVALVALGTSQDDAAASEAPPHTYECCSQRLQGRADGWYVPGSAKPAADRVPAAAG